MLEIVIHFIIGD